MSDNIATLKNKDNTLESSKSSRKKPLGITFIRIIVCSITILSCLFIKINRPEIFIDISNWYQKNVFCESISLEDIHKEFESIISKTNYYLSDVYQAYLKLSF